ncbi:MAG: 5-oxoprolinase subunit PxpA [Proteobacteria bacterium]|nr:5-oxoprolinase subunit PxpA [Pseudomonadota bacterium]MDA1330991.1 5-oxoprolinase subunit PxpA [Pseudomonadota bacterium]
MERYIDLNCDLGEYRSREEELKEIAIMPYLSSANIACGMHAGDCRSIRATARRAMEHDVGVGAHPSFPDRDNFGRKAMALPDNELRAVVRRQVEEFAGHALAVGAVMTHVKAHGALYNMAAIDINMAMAICETIADFNSDLFIFGLANSCWVQAAKASGATLVEEAFADRRYLSDRELVPRASQHALITDVEEAEQQVIKLVEQNLVTSLEGIDYRVSPDTICIHGDGVNALSIAANLRSTLSKHRIRVQYPVGRG